ncbi:MAG: DUF4150 domain-containing protein [Sedimentisphaerales bacterium]|nr:DUF4150 domain-containing protein [Sedimentisphaerales bacterium]
MFSATGMGGANFSLPDICRVPSHAGPIPIPYPSMGSGLSGLPNMATMYFKHPIVHGSKIPSSMGDQAGASGGVVSGTIMGPCYVKMTKLMDYHHGELLPRNSGLMCQAPNCNKAAVAYLPKNGQPVCLNCYHIGMAGSYPMPSQTKVMIAP